MSANPGTDAVERGGGFDPERFFELVRNVGHGRALALEYRQSAEDWIELALPWREELVGIPGPGGPCFRRDRQPARHLRRCVGLDGAWANSSRSSRSTCGSTIFGPR